MICILHGYLLEGSGSNLWTRSIIQALCRNGRTVHLVCQENHPERYEFISRAILYRPNGTEEILPEREVPYPGQCILHKPQLGDTLPVYVWDRYEEFNRVVPMVELDDTTVEEYLETNVKVIREVVKRNGIKAIHSNHAVLISAAAQRVAKELGIPLAVMPHGSAIVYAVQKDKRFFDYAQQAFKTAGKIFVIGPEMRSRLRTLFPENPDITGKLTDLNLAADTSLFNPIPPDKREENMSRLLARVKGVSGGKRRSQTRALLESITDDLELESLKKSMNQCSDYTAKLPDENLAEKFRSLDWSNEKIVLFVGRLIANKGPQTLVAALPSILTKQPDARVIVVGHGPLRETLEMFLFALEKGYTRLAQNMVRWGYALEEESRKPWESVAAYWDNLNAHHRLDEYFQSARQVSLTDRVIFTGYLTHEELRYLFPCGDVALFPSAVAEAGPLVFLEALASGCFPMGPYFGGMEASINSLKEGMAPEDWELLRLSADKSKVVADIVKNVPEALILGSQYKDMFRDIAVKKYDWKPVAVRFFNTLMEMGDQPATV